MHRLPGSARHEGLDDLQVTTPRLRITTTTVSGTAVIVHLDGEVDQDDRGALEGVLTKAVADRPPRLIVDLTGLIFCYSVCLNALLTARQDAQAAGVEMLLAAPGPQTLRLLEITGADEVFPIHASVRAALTAAARPHLRRRTPHW
ncbi:STAS domain-containing protein [Kitasatospora sp. NPDC018058]|uniref:STAS domain-containing protein n=1 Tax=Kitasatospora sp. NPDC018058 TaxID=3364025 RepID=UPI0037BF7362